MKRTYAIAIIALTALAAGPAEAFRLEPGLWRFTTTTNMSFNPNAKTDTRTQCITPDNADDILKELTAAACKVSDRTETSDQLKWKMECHQGGPNDPPMRGTGEINSHGESLDGKMDMALEVQGNRMTFNSTWKGKRLGECTSATKPTPKP